MIQRKLLTLFSLFTLYTLLSSHEFWLNPGKFIYKRGEKINIRFFVGENFEGENWKGNNQRVQSLKLYYDGVTDDLSKYITENAGDSLELTILDEGTHLIAFNSTNSFIELEAAKFNDYLKEDGLNAAIEYRSLHHELDSAGKENYQRCSKTLVQVGSKKSKTFSIAANLPVDIIPMINPYSIKNHDSLKVKILFQNAPLTDALVKIWNRKDNSTVKKEAVTNAKGEIAFPVTTSGKWMISTVKLIRQEPDSAVQWQSFWGTLTWGYE